MKWLVSAGALVCSLVCSAWTLQWDAGSGWPAGTTVEACLNEVCATGIAGTQRVFAESYPPGTTLSARARAVPPGGYQCGEPLAPCPPSDWTTVAQTIPANQPAPTTSAWQSGGSMAGFDYVASSFVNSSSNAYGTTITATTAVNAQTGDVIIAVVGCDEASTVSSLSSTNTTWTKIASFDHTGNGQRFESWRGVLTGSLSSGSTLTTTYAASVNWRLFQHAIFRSDNGSASPPVQAYNSTTYGSGSNPTTSNGMTVTVAPTGSNSLTIVEILEIEDASGATADSSPGTGFTQISEGSIFSDGTGPYLWAYKTGATSGSQSVTATYAQTSTYGSSIFAVVLEGGGAGGASYSYSASGGLTAGGAATLKRTSAQPVSGGLTTGGAATLKRTRAQQASGGLTTGGTGTLKRTHAQQASGGLTAGGAATLKLVKTAAASGGLTTGGAATLKRTSAQPVSGGLTTGGAATASKSSPGSNSHTASGGLTAGGAAGLKRTQKASGAGGLTTGGAAGLKRTQKASGAGGLTTGGAGTLKLVKTVATSGGLTTGGAAGATLQAGRSHVASGGLALGGMASLRILSNYIATGGLSLAGAGNGLYLPVGSAIPAGVPMFARATVLPKIG